jgi:geranyl-CoA carboxylase alpha subunit
MRRLGLKNNGRFLSDLVDHPAFRKAEMTTTLIDPWLEQGEPLLQAPIAGDAVWRVAAMTLAMHHGNSWRADSVAAFDVQLQCGEQVRVVRTRPDRCGGVALTLDGVTEHAQLVSLVEGRLRYAVDGVTRSAIAVVAGSQVHLAIDGHCHLFTEVSPFPDADALQDASKARSPVAGKVTQVLVAAGASVTVGQQLVCVEAMKMEMWLCAQAAGVVQAVHAAVGQQVESAALLVELELSPTKES